eukprot:366387-Chlamydomonas_euryale.AAC.22
MIIGPHSCKLSDRFGMFRYRAGFGFGPSTAAPIRIWIVWGGRGGTGPGGPTAVKRFVGSPVWRQPHRAGGVACRTDSSAQPEAAPSADALALPRAPGRMAWRQSRTASNGGIARPVASTTKTAGCVASCRREQSRASRVLTDCGLRHAATAAAAAAAAAVRRHGAGAAARVGAGLQASAGAAWRDRRGAERGAERGRDALTCAPPGRLGSALRCAAAPSVNWGGGCDGAPGCMAFSLQRRMGSLSTLHGK